MRITLNNLKNATTKEVLNDELLQQATRLIMANERTPDDNLPQNQTTVTSTQSLELVGEYDNSGALAFIVCTIVVYSMFSVCCIVINRAFHRKPRDTNRARDNAVDKYLKMERHLSFESDRRHMRNEIQKYAESIARYEEKMRFLQIQREIEAERAEAAQQAAYTNRRHIEKDKRRRLSFSFMPRKKAGSPRHGRKLSMIDVTLCKIGLSNIFVQAKAGEGELNEDTVVNYRPNVSEEDNTQHLVYDTSNPTSGPSDDTNQTNNASINEDEETVSFGSYVNNDRRQSTLIHVEVEERRPDFLERPSSVLGPRRPRSIDMKKRPSFELTTLSECESTESPTLSEPRTMDTLCRQEQVVEVPAILVTSHVGMETRTRVGSHSVEDVTSDASSTTSIHYIDCDSDDSARSAQYLQVPDEMEMSTRS